MFFILQKEFGDFYDVEVFNLWDILKKQKHQHDFTFINLEAMKEMKEETYRQAIPVGSLEFVESWLKKYHSIEKMNPIEVPDILRTNEFLKRKYSIVKLNEVPKSGYFFCKDASKLKGFSFSGDIEYLKKFEPSFLNKDNLFVVSEIIPIDSEYRVIVLDDKMEAIQFYNGSPAIFPDVNFIQKAIIKYQLDSLRPRAYALDIGISQKAGTFIIENHPTTSFGTYGYVSSNLPYIYKYGIDYYLNINKKLNEFNNG